jgi:hypothetical protein
VILPPMPRRLRPRRYLACNSFNYGFPFLDWLFHYITDFVIAPSLSFALCSPYTLVSTHSRAPPSFDSFHLCCSCSPTCAPHCLLKHVFDLTFSGHLSETNEFEYEWMSSVCRRADVRTTGSYRDDVILLTKSLTSITARTDWHVN